MRRAALLLALSFAACGAAPAPTKTRTAPAASAAATYAPGELEATMEPEIERWLTENSPAGVTGLVSDVTCQRTSGQTYKCGVKGQTYDANRGMGSKGFMTVLVGPDESGEFAWSLTEGWTECSVSPSRC